MWSTSPETEENHIFLTLFEEPQQYQEQILSIPLLLTLPLPGKLQLLRLQSWRCCLSQQQGRGFVFPPKFLFCQLTRHHLLGHMRGASVTACNGNGTSFISTTPGPLMASETQSSQMEVEPLRMPKSWWVHKAAEV